jgi:hypothetical protein
MKQRFNFNTLFRLLAVIVLIAILSSCAKEVLRPDVLSGDQLISGRMDGTWAKPSDIVTPAGVPPDVFGAMRLVFTTDEAGNPAQFIAQDCPIVFSNAVSGSWKITGTTDSAQVSLVGLGPVDDFKAKVSANFLNLSFYMGWENTDTKATGKGTFKVTLSRQ